MDKTNDLQTALWHFDVFYKNIEELIKVNKKANKKYFGHNLFKKSENALFSLFETGLICAGSLVSCILLKQNGLLPFDPFLTASVGCVAGGALAVLTNNIIYHINNNAGGPIGRTYAKMQCDDYFVCLKEFIKKDYKELLSNKVTNEQKLEKIIKFATLLDNVSQNLNYDYQKLCKRVSKYSPKRQQKWAPILEHVDEYRLYLLNNAEKFNQYAKKLEEYSIPFLVQTETNLEDLVVSCFKKHSSEFIQFKEYLQNKKSIENMFKSNKYVKMDDEKTNYDIEMTL